MSNLTSLQRKLLYLGGIVLLLIPITWLGLPAEPARGGKQGSAGGLLAQKREQFEYGEHDLGNVDPASSTMNLLLLGFRGFATSVLWTEAIDQQRNKDWAGLRATTESIILLQPHFLKVWHFQGWNLAYNVSAEWDGVTDRYYWVKEGIKFFKKGRDRNARYAELYWYVGDTTGKKIGRSDEAVQFRKYFRHDPDVARYNDGPDPEVNRESLDNYQVAGISFQQANDTIVKYDNEQHIMAPYLFRAYPQRANFDHAMALQREGEFGEVVRNIWADGFRDWTTKYGMMDLDCEVLNKKIHLEVSRDELAAMDKRDIAANKDPFHRETTWIGKYQDQANYPYWRARSRLESEKEMSEAHRLLYEGEEALHRADPVNAIDLYLQGMTKFDKLLQDNDYKQMKTEDETIEEALLAVMGWQRSLELIDEEIPEQFPLKDMWERNAARQKNIRLEFDRRRRSAK
ncbi:MAG: hypothetical protein HY290_00320 [Planctomycetia bacterium]|nr:hypothetical protein [Planctomycetia bacterium]